MATSSLNESNGELIHHGRLAESRNAQIHMLLAAMAETIRDGKLTNWQNRLSPSAS